MDQRVSPAQHPLMGGRLEGVQLTALRQIDSPGGRVMHGLKASEEAFHGFGEAYFSSIEQGQVKAWKRHRRMVCNLVVPVGSIRLKLFDDRVDSASNGQWQQELLGPDNYLRLTIPAGLWFGFEGLAAGLNLMLNLASVEHDPTEAETRPVADPRFQHSGW